VREGIGQAGANDPHNHRQPHHVEQIIGIEPLFGGQFADLFQANPKAEHEEEFGQADG